MRDETKTPAELSLRTKEFALRIIRLYCSLSKSTQAQVLGKQVLRSGTSVGANYREAKRSRSKAEFIAKIGDCLKELDETAYWLELLLESGTIASSQMKGLHQECDELLAIFTTISKKTKASAIHTS
ncbi:MAG: four helix bundle protein [Verrucomicrobiota bacterium]|jgi:four helix bundle protein